MSVPVKFEKARQIVAAMTANPTIFETPTPNLASVSDAADALESAYNDAKGGGNKSKTALMYNKEKDLDDLLTRLGHYVEDISLGDAQIILLADMDVKNPGGPVSNLDPPVNLEAGAGDASGEISLIWKPVDHALNYMVQISSGNNAWTQLDIVTKARYVASGLTPGVHYSFRVAALGTPGVGPWSDAASCFSI